MHSKSAVTLVQGGEPMNRRSRIARAMRRSLTVLSLLLCVAAVVMWTRSYWREDSFFNVAPGGLTWRDFISTRGEFIVEKADAPTPAQSQTVGGWKLESTVAQPEPLGYAFWRWRFLGFKFTAVSEPSGDGREQQTLKAVAIPYCAIVATSGALGLLTLVRLARARRRERIGLCPTCGYDLRATPDRCPECGTEVGKETMKYEV